MIRPTLLSILLLASAYTLPAQGFRIEGVIKGLKDTTCILGHYSYTNTSFLSKDTARVDSNGKMVFQGKENLPGGLYLVLFPGNTKWLELVYSGQETNFSFVTDTSLAVNSTHFTNSRENEAFYSYRSAIQGLGVKSETLRKQMESAKDAGVKEKIAKETEDLQGQFKTLFINFTKTHADLFASKMLLAAQNPEIPKARLKPDGTEDRDWVFNTYKSQFWKNFDLSDDRLLKTPFIKPKLEQYFKNLVAQVPDSIIKDADRLIALSKSRPVREYLIWYITNEYENSKVLGVEPVYVHMAEKYYLKGEMDMTEEGLKRVRERVNIVKPLLPGKALPDMVLTDINKKPVNLYSIQAPYTIVYLFSPTCGHCKEGAPKLKEFYDKNQAKGVKVMMVPTDESDEEWAKFIKEYHLENLIHARDRTHTIDFRNKYDVYSTPTVYVLDKNKKVLTRKVPTEELDGYLQFLINKGKNAETK